MKIINIIKIWALKYVTFIYKFFFNFQKQDTNFLYFFRVSIGLFCLIHFISILQDFDFLYARTGFIDPTKIRILRPIWIPDISTVISYIHNTLRISEDSLLICFKVVFIILCCFLTSGFLSRFTAISLLILHLIMVKGTPVYSYGVDQFTSIALFYCCVFPINREVSVDNLIFKLKKINPTPYRKILQLHLCIVYFSSGVLKLVGANWRNGESIWKSLNLPAFYPVFKIDYSFMINYPIIPIVLGWGVIIIETFYPVFVWEHPYKNIWLALVCLMHLGIFFCLGLYFFSTLMMILSLTAFLDLEQ